LNVRRDAEDGTTRIVLRCVPHDLPYAEPDRGELVAEIVTDQAQNFVPPGQDCVGVGAFEQKTSIRLSAHSLEKVVQTSGARSVFQGDLGISVRVLLPESRVLA
jgi:hypothetical protein